MKKLFFITPITAVVILGLVSCAAVPTVQTDSLKSGTVYQGAVTETGVKKSAASNLAQVGSTLVGVGVGSAIGGGGGKAAAMVAGGLLGDAAVNHFDPKQVEEMTVELDNGTSVIVDVQGTIFKVGDRVKVSMSGGQVNSIVRD